VVHRTRRAPDFIVDVVTREEERFRRTLESGHQLLDTELEQTGQRCCPVTVAFKLHDTFGFPIELTKEIASERGRPSTRRGSTARWRQRAAGQEELEGR
jgi:alanyl-tRNA synthetase